MTYILVVRFILYYILLIRIKKLSYNRKDYNKLHVVCTDLQYKIFMLI